MKIIARRQFFLLFFIIPIFCISQEKKLNGNVKSTREKVIFVNDSIQNYKLLDNDGDYGHSGFTTSKGTIFRFYENWYNSAHVHYLNNKRIYNEKGLVISEDWFYKNDKKFKTFNYEYTKFDSLTRITDKDYNNNFESLTYNYQNKIQSRLNYYYSNNDEDNDHGFELVLFQFDNSKKIKESIYYEEGLSYEKFFTYDKDNLLNKITIHNLNFWPKYDEISFNEKTDSVGNYYTQSLKYYNEKKELIKEEKFTEPEYNRGSILSELKYYKYDERKNCTEETIKYGYSGVEYLKSKKFDSKNRIIDVTTSTSDDSNPWDESMQYVYNERDELITLFITTKKTNYKVSFTYKYDKQNNWIEQTKSIDGKKLFIWKRQITYY